MCGAVAVLKPARKFEEAMARIAHRGIRQKIVETPRAFVGHSRLPIVGLDERFDQPAADHRDTTVAFVGEILDFREYTDEESDLPLVIRKWRYGLKDHDGFWHVIAEDELGIHVVADYLCQKPAYYRSDEHAVGAASEPAAVACLGPTTPDEIYFSSVVKWGYCPETDRTPYNEVKKVLPGERVYLTKHPGNIQKRIVDPLVPKDMKFILKDLIVAAVKRRVLSSDVPVACLVSGGLDSSIVYTLAKRFGDVKAYHVENGEAAEASIVVGSNACQLVHLGGDDVSEKVATDYMHQCMQEPIDLGSLIPQAALANTVKERVCLTGDGADELFGGYSRAQRYDSQASDVWHELVAWHLPRLDRVMMRNRIEVRSPFLARQVAVAALALPYDLRQDKHILRHLFRDDLPPGIADRPKKALRTKLVQDGREKNSRMLVEAFRRLTWSS